MMIISCLGVFYWVDLEHFHENGLGTLVWEWGLSLCLTWRRLLELCDIFSVIETLCYGENNSLTMYF